MLIIPKWVQKMAKYEMLNGIEMTEPSKLNGTI